MRVFSGVQPTGSIHIGNYLGALKQWITLQEKNECIFCIVDLHSLTVPYPVKKLQKRIREKTIAYLAAGVDPEKSIIFLQSEVPEHTELCWLLSTVTPFGDLQRMTQYKEKSTKYKKSVNAGLLNYPILMAADILLYETDIVPVGQDQKQHIELTRKIARNFNKRFGKTFKVPESLLPKRGAKIMSLENPNKKMSKSDLSSSYISLFDSPEIIKKKIRRAQTDSGKEVKFNAKAKPGISNLLTIFSLFSGLSIKELENDFKSHGYYVFKEKLAQLLIEKLEPFRRKKKELELQQPLLEKILEEGRKRAQIIAQETMSEVRKKMGLNR
ncbi:MAG: tryptophan--tRNA ligase [Patescibacteria group bacterium]|nr:tryptophan--tRNA ligase [Patescibacteria group bacterium]